MLRNYYINKEWMVSGTARRSYRVAAGLSLVLFFVVFFIAVAAQVGAIPDTLLPVVKLLLLAGVLGAATTMVAMEYFLFGFDNSSAMKKVFWFCVMLFPLLGPTLYCFIVYSHSDVLKANCAKRLEGASE
ncbi:MAG TPA: hypothetical protein VKD23_18185 [Terriglobales bacterium]|nr:hypothetical protein [Terriglobales bacterium]